MNKSHFKYVILGFVLVIPLIIWQIFKPRSLTESEWVASQFAKHTGLDAKEFLTIKATNERIRHKKATDSDWAVSDKYCHSPAIDFRVTIEVSLESYKGTVYESRAIGLVKELAHDPDPGIKMIALTSLQRMKAPGADDYLKEAELDPDPRVRNLVTNILKKKANGQRI